MRKLLLTLGLVAATTTAGPALSNDVTTQVRVTEDFLIGSTGWTGAFAGKFILAWRPIVVEGTAVLCGAFAVSNIQLRQPSYNMLRQGQITVAGRPVLRNLRYFNQTNVRQEDEIIGQVANCTPLPAGIGDQRMTIELGDGSFRN